VTKTVGDDFQTETKYIRNKMFGGNLNWVNKPEIYKSYPSSRTIQLSSSLKETTMGLSEILRRRKSIRAFSNQPLSQVDLAFLLWHRLVSKELNMVTSSEQLRRLEHCTPLKPT